MPLGEVHAWMVKLSKLQTAKAEDSFLFCHCKLCHGQQWLNMMTVGVHLKLLLEVKEAKIQEVANSES